MTHVSAGQARSRGLTVFRLLLGIAIAAILLHLAVGPLRSRARSHHERCMQIADNHARIGAEYRRNARGDADMLRCAAWHEQMRREFERAARRPEAPVPRSELYPPDDWQPPAIEDVRS